MDWRGFPPLSALRAFSAFAGAATLDQAGARIGVTHAAISQQIRVLEDYLGLKLVQRGGRKLELTPEGRRLAEALEGGFGQIAACLAALTGADAARPLRITTSPSFASGWLLPRLPDFRACHPGIDLVIDPSPDLREIGTEADIGLRYGKGHWPGLDAQLLISTPVVVVAAPALVAEGRQEGLAHLAGLPWLQELGTTEATAFLEAHGLTRRDGVGMLSLPGNLVLDAVRDGQGVAVIARAFVEGDLAAGRLCILHEDWEREGYFLVTRSGVLRPAVKAFAAWALRQGAAGISRAT